MTNTLDNLFQLARNVDEVYSRLHRSQQECGQEGQGGQSDRRGTVQTQGMIGFLDILIQKLSFSG